MVRRDNFHATTSDNLPVIASLPDGLSGKAVIKDKDQEKNGEPGEHFVKTADF